MVCLYLLGCGLKHAARLARATRRGGMFLFESGHPERLAW
jgi:hypothetical protein